MEKESREGEGKREREREGEMIRYVVVVGGGNEHLWDAYKMR